MCHYLTNPTFRYSSLSFLGKLQFDTYPLREIFTTEQIISELIDEGKALEESMMQNESEVVANKTVNPRKRKSRFLSTICDDKNEETCSRNYNISEEIERYQEEDPISANDCFEMVENQKEFVPCDVKTCHKISVCPSYVNCRGESFQYIREHGD